ncbi:hypothetical protein ACSSV6_003170, partial [Roseovarius sp. MBR-38]
NLVHGWLPLLAVSQHPTWHIAMPKAGAIHFINGVRGLTVQDAGPERALRPVGRPDRVSGARPAFGQDGFWGWVSRTGCPTPRRSGSIARGLRRRGWSRRCSASSTAIWRGRATSRGVVRSWTRLSCRCRAIATPAMKTRRSRAATCPRAGPTSLPSGRGRISTRAGARRIRKQSGGAVFPTNDVACGEGWRAHLLDPGAERVGVHGTLDQHRGVDPVVAQPCDEGVVAPVPMRDGPDAGGRRVPHVRITGSSWCRARFRQ